MYIFLPCVGCSCVQGCTAVRFLCCASFSAVAAQCALWVRGGRDLFYKIETSILLFCSAQHPCTSPALRAAAAEGDVLCSSFFALALLQNGIIDQRSKTCSVLHNFQALHQRKRGRRHNAMSSLHEFARTKHFFQHQREARSIERSA